MCVKMFPFLYNVTVRLYNKCIGTWYMCMNAVSCSYSDLRNGAVYHLFYDTVRQLTSRCPAVSFTVKSLGPSFDIWYRLYCCHCTSVTLSIYIHTCAVVADTNLIPTWIHTPICMTCMCVHMYTQTHYALTHGNVY